MLSNNRISGLIALFLAALVISGCSSTATAPVEQQEPVAEPPVAAAPVEEVQEPEDFAEDGVTPLDANGRPLSRNFYFGYDEAILNPADLAALEMHAQILRRNADKHASLKVIVTSVVRAVQPGFGRETSQRGCFVFDLCRRPFTSD